MSKVKPSWEQVFDKSNRRVRGIWKRGKTFYAQLTITNPSDGLKVTRRLSLRAKTISQAIEGRNNLRLRAANGEVYGKRGCPTLGDYVEHYLETMQAQKRPKTIYNERSFLKRWEDFFGRDMRLSDITPRNIIAYRTARKAAGISARTQNLELIALRSLMKLAKQERHISLLPTAEIKNLKAPRTQKKLLRPTEIESLIQTALEKCPQSGRAFADFLRLAAYTGARMSEVLQLKWADVDWKDESICLRPETTKNGRIRYIHFNAKLRTHLVEMDQRRNEKTDWLFPSPRPNSAGGRIISFNTTLRKVRDKTGVEFTNHLLRHYFCSMCVMAGIDYMTIAKWLGHLDGGVLIGNTYGHLRADHMKTQAAKLKNL